MAKNGLGPFCCLQSRYRLHWPWCSSIAKVECNSAKFPIQVWRRRHMASGQRLGPRRRKEDLCWHENWKRPLWGLLEYIHFLVDKHWQSNANAWWTSLLLASTRPMVGRRRLWEMPRNIRHCRSVYSYQLLLDCYWDCRCHWWKNSLQSKIESRFGQVCRISTFHWKKKLTWQQIPGWDLDCHVWFLHFWIWQHWNFSWRVKAYFELDCRRIVTAEKKLDFVEGWQMWLERAG